MRKYIKNELGIELYDIYGLTEIYGPGIGISCSENAGMHYWDDYVYIEIVDPKTLQPVADGEEGEIVITTLVKEGAPLLRFRTHDISRIIPGTCACGRTYPRLDMIKGRSDDMFKVHGVNMAVGEVWTDKAPRNQDALLTEAEKMMYQDKADFYKRTGIDRRKY